MGNVIGLDQYLKSSLNNFSQNSKLGMLVIISLTFGLCACSSANAVGSSRSPPTGSCVPVNCDQGRFGSAGVWL